MKTLQDLAKAAIESLRELRAATPHNETGKIQGIEDVIEGLADDYGLGRCQDCREYFDSSAIALDGAILRCERCIELAASDVRTKAETRVWINRGGL